MKAKAPDFSQHFGQTLKKLRQERGMTQKQLAEIVEVDLPRISKYERGLVYPTTEMIATLADVFQISIDYLIRGEYVPEVQVVYSTELAKRLESMSRLPLKDQQIIIDVIDTYIRRRELEEK